MTAQEYNHVFLPRINRAEEFVELFESSIEHMSETRVDKDEVRKQFRIENGKCEHLRYMRSKGAQCSQKIFDCMHELILKACSETEE